MSQNGMNHRVLSSRVAAGGSGEALGQGGGNCSSSNMNRITSSHSWSHSQVGSSPNNGTELAVGHQLAAAEDFDARAPPVIGGGGGVGQTPQSSSSSQTGTSLKEHDLLGMSEVSSSITTTMENSAVPSRCDFGGEVDLGLDLGSTELRLGPQEFSHRQHGDSLRMVEHFDGGAGRCHYGRGPDADSLAADRRSSTADLGSRSEEQYQQQQVARRGLTYSPLTILEEGERQAIDSETLHRLHPTDGLRLQTGRSLGMSPHQDEIVERKMLLGGLDGTFQEAVPGRPQGASDGTDRHRLATMYQDGPWQNRAQDASLVERVTPMNVHEGREVADHQQESRGLAAECGETLGWARQQRRLESRYLADWGSNAAPLGLGGKSTRHPDYLVPASQKSWQAQHLRSRDDFQTHFGQPVEGGRNVHPGPLSGTVGAGFAGATVAFNSLYKMEGAAGTKRSFDTASMVSETENFADGRGDGVMSSPVTVGNSTPIATSNPGPCEADAKSKVQQQQQQAPLYPWSGKAPPNSWHTFQGTGGSLGPFSHYQGSPGASGRDVGTSTPTNVGVSGELSRKAWETHGKGSQDPALQGQTSLKELNFPGAVPPSSSPVTEVTSSVPRKEAKPVQAGSWPPLPKSRKEAKPAPLAESSRKPCPPPPTPPPQATSPASVASLPDKCRVKVYLDGFYMVRKLDLKAGAFYDYESLAVAVEDTFSTVLNWSRRRFLHGSEYVLTYEDRDGDLMLVGDVPWTLFIDNVKRLRIMKGSEADGLAGSRAAKNNKSRPAL